MNYNYGIMEMIFRKDDNWRLSRGAYVFVIIGLLLLLSAITAVIIIVDPWTVILQDFYIYPFIHVCSNILIYIFVLNGYRSGHHFFYFFYSSF